MTPRAARIQAKQLAGRPASTLWDLPIDRYPGYSKESLMESVIERGRPALGWDHRTGEPAWWDTTATHLAIHYSHAPHTPQVLHMGLMVAVQLHLIHGADAVTVVDASHTANDAAYWEPLRQAGMRILPVAVDPGRAAGALAALADTAAHRDRTGHTGPRPYLVVLDKHMVRCWLAHVGERAYASAARTALRRLQCSSQVTQVATDSKPSWLPTWSLFGSDEPVTTPWSELEPLGEDEGYEPWDHRIGAPRGLLRSVKGVEIPGLVSPAWWAEQLTRFAQETSRAE